MKWNELEPIKYLGHDAEGASHTDLAHTNNGDLTSGVDNRGLDLSLDSFFSSCHCDSVKEIEVVLIEKLEGKVCQVEASA